MALRKNTKKVNNDLDARIRGPKDLKRVLDDPVPRRPMPGRSQATEPLQRKRGKR